MRKADRPSFKSYVRQCFRLGKQDDWEYMYCGKKEQWYYRESKFANSVFLLLAFIGTGAIESFMTVAGMPLMESLILCIPSWFVCFLVLTGIRYMATWFRLISEADINDGVLYQQTDRKAQY